MSQPPALDPGEFRRLGHRTVDLIADYLEGLTGRPVFTPMPATARRVLWEQPLPDQGRPPDELLAWCAAHLLPYPMGNGHPRFFGRCNGSARA